MSTVSARLIEQRRIIDVERLGYDGSVHRIISNIRFLCTGAPAVKCTGPHRPSTRVTTNVTVLRKQRVGAWIFHRQRGAAYGD
jgi:hypothetical protein